MSQYPDEGAGRQGNRGTLDLVCEDIGDACTTPIKCCLACFFVVAALIVTIVVLATSLSQIDSTHVGLAYNAYQAQLTDDVKEEGLHFHPTFGYFILWPKTHQTLKQVVKCMSKDAVEISVTVSFQYIPIQKKIRFLTLRYQDFKSYASVLRLQSRSGIRDACSLFTAQGFQTSRAAFQGETLNQLKRRLVAGQMHATIIELQVTNINRPVGYEKAVDAKEAARNEIDRIKNKRTQLVTQAFTKLMKVKVAANKTIDTANTAAAITTRNADAEAAIVLGRYKAQGELYKKVRSTRGLSAEGLLAYIGTRLVDELNGIVVGLDAPARMSYLSSGNSTQS